MGVKFRSPIVVKPYRLKWFDVEFPDPSPHEVIFRNRACLICGSDLHLYKGLHPYAPLPACTGHEVASDVVEVGNKVTSLEVGDEVYVAGTGASPVACGGCLNCGRGFPEKCSNPHVSVSFEVGGKRVARFPSGFGEYTMGHEGKAFKLPDGVTHLEAAVTTDMAYVIGVVKRSGAKIGDSAIVLGSGPIGLRTVEVARLAGIDPIIVSEPVGYRLERARELGAQELINPMEEDAVVRVMEITEGDGVDYVFDTTGSARATAQGVEMLNTRFGGLGTLVLMGLYENPKLIIDASKLMRKAGRIFAEWGIRIMRRKNIEDALKLMSEGKINVSKWITHQLQESQAEEGMMMLIEKREEAIGVEIVH